MTSVDVTKRRISGAAGKAFLAALLLAGGSAHAVLPDTGQTTCYDSSGATDCANPAFPRQDGAVAATPPAYTKLDAAGNALPDSAGVWSCMRDNVTGLVWEAKTADGGPRDAGHRYVWEGTGDTETCANTLGGLACTAAAYVAAMNAGNLCGATDWRLPTRIELFSVIRAGAVNPAVDPAFLPTASRPCWSATTYAMDPGSAWGVHFGSGAAHAEGKGAANAVRLVRGTWTP